MAIDSDKITLEEGPSKGRYAYRVGDDEAVMTYSKAGEHLIIIDHTGVPPAFRGAGVGLALVERGVADARKAGKQILPLCTFAAAQFRKHPEWADVLQGAKKEAQS